jgi:hypothetical protein
MRSKYWPYFDESPPNTILEAAYWRDPVQVLSGVVWLVVGFGLGVLLA